MEEAASAQRREMFPIKQHALNKRKVKKYWLSKIIIIWLN
jgi:hypothetical protein